ncbi:MAG: hypothetical protein WAK98_08925 [Gemmobacter sp.]
MTEIAAGVNPKLTDHLPFFIPGADGSDGLMTFTAFFVVGMIFVVGILYLKLHALPEQMAGHTRKLQMDIVAVLALIALFTHQNIFWIAALLLAMIDLPDFGSPLKSIAASLEKMAGLKGDDPDTPPDDDGAMQTGAMQTGAAQTGLPTEAAQTEEARHA